MPRGAPYSVELEAVSVFRQAYVEDGWTPGPLLGQRRQRVEGCDFFVTPPGGGKAHPIEVKGRSGSIFSRNGLCHRELCEVNVDQLKRARTDPNWKLEIVANLSAYRAGKGPLQCLTLTAKEVVVLAQGWKYRISLEGLESRVKEQAG